MSNFLIEHALKNLVEGASFAIKGDSLEGITWYGPGDQPSDEDILAEMEVVKAKVAAEQYKEKRFHEYPPFAWFLDAWVKNDEAGLEAYRQACLAVKAKYPKPAE